MSKFHCFLSHDWKTSRGLKVVAILIYFNGRAAMIAAVVCAIIVGLCRETGPLLEVELAGESGSRITTPLTLLPQLVFVLFFCLWQRMRSFFKRPRIAFLDKLCIAQHDPSLKAQGILGLASFLDASEELTILWSPRYYTRLWCCFELAAFLRKRASSNARVTVLYVPTSWMLVSWILLLLAGVAAIQIQDWQVSTGTRPAREHNTLPGVADIPYWLFSWACCSVWSYLLLGLWPGIRDVDRQLREFSVRKSECFCCANHHKHPGSGQTLPCDREMVYDAVKDWYLVL